jgi:hypothetical protein
MEAPLLLIAALLVTALVFVVIPVALDAYQRFHHSKVLICPDSRLIAYSDEIATESDAKRHAFRRKSAVREVGAKRRWDFVHNLRGLVFASQVIISWFF